MRAFFLSLFLATIAFLNPQKVDAAGPVTHAYLAECWLDQLGIDDEDYRGLFLVGTLFPDIRHLGAPVGEEVYFPGVTLEDIENMEDPFLAGMLFHSFVDDSRNAFIATAEVFDIFEGLPEESRGLLLTFLEDEATFPLYNWNNLNKSLKTTYEEELQWGVPEEFVQYWHKMLNYCFSYKPSQLLYFMSEKGFQDVSPETIKTWKKSFSKLYQSREMKEYNAALLQHFQEKLQGR